MTHDQIVTEFTNKYYFLLENTSIVWDDQFNVSIVYANLKNPARVFIECGALADAPLLLPYADRLDLIFGVDKCEAKLNLVDTHYLYVDYRKQRPATLDSWSDTDFVDAMLDKVADRLAVLRRELEQELKSKLVDSTS